MRNLCKIFPIFTCKLILDKGHFTYRMNHGEKILFPVYSWLINGEKGKILVDTGCSFEEMKRYSVAPKKMEGQEGPPIEESLQKMGVQMSDIETIILTHLHFDHFLNAKKFPNAKLIIQEEELKFAMNPHPLFSSIYNRQWYEGLTFETVKGDTEIIPGVEVIFTPGHTPGNQSVSITTERGRVVIAGFCSIDENFGEEGVIVPGLHTDPLGAYDSIIKVKRIADVILPCHSGRYLGVVSIP